MEILSAPGGDTLTTLHETLGIYRRHNFECLSYLKASDKCRVHDPVYRVDPGPP